MRIAIFDLQFMNYVYHSTPRPSAFTMLISGYHKSRGDSVVFADHPPEFGLYDIVYINKDERGLYHDPHWLSYPNVVPVGRYWEGMEYGMKLEWEQAPPDATIYHNWVNAWISKYKKYNPDRLNSFFLEPVKLKQGEEFKHLEGTGYLVIDYNIVEWKDWDKYLNSLEVDLCELLYPFVVNETYDFDTIFKFFSESTHVWKGDKKWIEIEGVPFSRVKELTKAFNLHHPGFSTRIKLILQESTNARWMETIENAIHFIGHFRLECKRRIYVYPYNIQSFKYPRILKEIKRWTGFNMSYKKNTCFDYMLIDACRDLERTFDFLEDPYQYIEDGRQGSNKLECILQILEEDPKLFELITEPYFGTAYS